MRPSALFAASFPLLAVAAGLVLGRAAAPAAAAPGDQKIGVVDIADLLKTAPGKLEITTRYDQRKDELAKWGKAESDRIKSAQSALELLPRTDPTRPQKEKELDKSMVDFKFEGEYRTRDNEVKYTDEMEALYETIKAAIRDVATQNGLTLVFVKSDERVEANRLVDFMGNVALRPVVYYERSTDITQAVKDRLNASRVPPPVPPTGKPSGTPPPPPANNPPPNNPPPNPPPAMGR